jgi:hypothetical protein
LLDLAIQEQSASQIRDFSSPEVHEARARISYEMKEQTTMSPPERAAHLQGGLDDWRGFSYFHLYEVIDG